MPPKAIPPTTEQKLKAQVTKLKAQLKEAKEYTAPVQHDVQVIYKSGPWKWVAVGVILLLVFVFLKQCSNSNNYDGLVDKIDSLKEAANSKDSSIKAKEEALIIYEQGAEDALTEADEATADRIATETTGLKEIEKAKTYTDEVKKKISDPNVTDAIRERMATDLLRSRDSAKVRYRY